jgi:AcrR family transcriptional regulator
VPDVSVVGRGTDAARGGAGARRRAHRRAEFVDAAVRAVRAGGPTVSVADIAAAAGVTKPVLYRHFADRADLQKAVGERVAATLLGRVGDELGRPQPPVERTRAVIDAVLASVEEDPGLWRFVTHDAVLPVGDQVVDNVREQIARLLAVQLADELGRRGQDRGGAAVWAHGLVGMVHGVAEWWLEHPAMSRVALVDSLAALVWSGVADVFAPATPWAHTE